MQEQIKEEQKNSQFQNDRLSVQATRKPGCTVHLEVEMTPDAVKSAYELAVRAVKKEVSIPGFRKGKVPEEIVKHNFSSAINKEFKDTALQTAFNESLTLTGLRPFSRNSLRRSELKKCSLETGASALFDFETHPEIPTVDIEKIETRPTTAQPVSTSRVEMNYKQMQLMHATWEEVQERTVERGDFVELDIDVIQHPAHNVCIDQLFWIDQDKSPAWILDTVIGMLVNESKEVEATPKPSDPAYPIVYEENQPAKQCRITVKKIKKAILPEETEEFAKSYGASSIEELKNTIKERLIREEQEYANELSRYNLRRELIEKYLFDIPQSLISAEVHARVAHAPKGANVSKGSLPSDQDKEKNLRAQAEAEARGFFTWMFLIQPFAAQANIAVSHEELEAELNRQIRLPQAQRLIYPSLGPEDIRSRLFMLVMMRKCEDYLLAKVST